VITVVQRVQRARVVVAGETVGEIDRGLLLFVGVEAGDTPRDADETARKVQNLRIFPKDKPTDLSVADIGGGCLVVSQFTLAAELQRGNRPDFTAAAHPDLARPLYERVAARLRDAGLTVATGRFAASMEVELVNDGPMTYLLRVLDGKAQPRQPQR
jgi:D-tyrosyl-tRNA(Tyr) deacylase